MIVMFYVVLESAYAEDNCQNFLQQFIQLKYYLLMLKLVKVILF